MYSLQFTFQDLRRVTCGRCTRAVSRAWMLIGFVALAMPASAYASTLGLTSFSEVGAELTLNDTFDLPRTVGWSFVANQNLVVEGLGVYDVDGDGLGMAAELGLWAETGQMLLASATVPAGTSEPLTSGFRFVPVSPVNLVAGQTYVLGFNTLRGGDLAYHNVPSFTTSPLITYGQPRNSDANTGFAFPDIFDARIPNGIFGPNVLFQDSTPIPEPATVSLLGIGAAAVVRWRCRKRTR